MNGEEYPMEITRITFPVDNLSSRGGGVLTIERALIRTPGVVYVYVNSATEMAYVKFDPALCDSDRLLLVVERVGFHAGRPAVR
jgi:hypothetical protein